MVTAVLKKGRELSVIKRHPWVYSGSISKISGNPAPGDVVSVVSSTNELLGHGWYSPYSQIRIRMLSFDPDEKIDEEFFFSRISTACRFREEFSENIQSNAYRLINSEGDGLPGLIVDKYDDYLVCQFLSAGAERIKDFVASSLVSLFNPFGIYERSDAHIRRLEGLSLTKQDLYKEVPDRVKIWEKDVSFWVDIKNGHKTGFYLDQRENRYCLREISNKKSILNCFAYTGGFGIHSLMVGARRVINVDRSIEGLSLLKDNLKLNGIPVEKTEVIRENVFKILLSYRDRNEFFDIVILDPPKFVKNTSQLRGGINGYKKINKRALQIIRPGGFLITFSCSGLVDRDLFKKIILDSAIDCGANISVIKELSMGIDHPYLPGIDSSNYLKGFIIRVM